MSFDKLRNEVEEACQKCFTALRQIHSEENICGYSIYSDAGAMSVSPALNTKAHLEEAYAQDPEDATYYKWNTGEWAHEFEGAEFFEDISRSPRKEIEELDIEEKFSNFKNNVHEACVESLETLIRKGFFATDNEDCIIVFTLSDAEDPKNEIKWIERLNREKESNEFRNWVLNL